MASAKILESKKAKVAALAEVLKNSTAGVLVDYKGITVEEDTKLGKALREANQNYWTSTHLLLYRSTSNHFLN